MKGLAGKRVVVTGGSSGIGAATAQRFRDEGAEVIVLSRHPGPGGIACDVGDRDQIGQAFELIGDLDVLVNNAGMSVRTPAAEIPAQQWDAVVATNLSGAFWAAQAAGRRYRRSSLRVRSPSRHPVGRRRMPRGDGAGRSAWPGVVRPALCFPMLLREPRDSFAE